MCGLKQTDTPIYKRGLSRFDLIIKTPQDNPGASPDGRYRLVPCNCPEYEHDAAQQSPKPYHLVHHYPLLKQFALQAIPHQPGVFADDVVDLLVGQDVLAGEVVHRALAGRPENLKIADGDT